MPHLRRNRSSKSLTRLLCRPNRSLTLFESTSQPKRNRTRTKWPFVLVLMLWCASAVAKADLPLARLSTLWPPGGSTGKSVEVSVTGSDLDGLREMRFSDPRITGKMKAAEPPGKAGGPGPFVVTIPAGVRPGIYEARVVGLFGISNPRAFEVSDLPEIVQKPTNHTSGTAAPVSVGCVINSRAEASAADYYQFEAQVGQRILIECHGVELDSRIEPTLFLYTATGRELERSRRGGLLDYTVAESGEYRVKVHDALFRGGDEYFYRLAISTHPHIDFIFPPAGVAGTKGKYTLYGRNLPGGCATPERAVDGKVLERLEVEIDLPPRGAVDNQVDAGTSVPWGLAMAGADEMTYRLLSTNGVSNPVRISLADAPVAVERKPNSTATSAQPIDVPGVYVGQFFPLNDRDWIRFKADKGEMLDLEVTSQRLGFSTDPLVVIQHVSRNKAGEEYLAGTREFYAADANLGGAEFKTATRDPAGRFEAKEGGEYRIEVRDLFNSEQSDPRRVYALEVRKPAPDFRLLALPQAPPFQEKDRREARVWTTLLRRGETLPVKVLAFRRDDFEGEIELGAEGLPEGVTFAAAGFEAKQSATVLLLRASEDAVAWAGTIRIVGRAKICGQEVIHRARAGCVVRDVKDYNEEAVRSRLTDEFYLALSSEEAAPLAIEAAQAPEFGAAAGGKIEIPLKLTARGEMTGNIKLKAAGFSELDGLKEVEISAKTNQVNLEIDLAQHKVPVGTHRFYVLAYGQTRYQRPMVPSAKTNAPGDKDGANGKGKKEAKPALEERSFVAYSGVLTLKVNEPKSDARTPKSQ
jgi:hypothetical protein